MMRNSRLLIASVAVLAACSSKETPSSSGTTGGTLIIAGPGDPVDVFPPYVTDQNGRMVQDLVFDRLADISPDLTTIGDKGFKPALAQKWTWAPDSLSIAFSIDPRARWHDGKPVTANDVRYSVRVFTDPKVGSPTAPLLGNIDSVSVRDSLTAVVFFKKHTPEQFYDLVYQVAIVPEHVYGAIPFDQLHTSPITRTPIGSGRFRFVKWEPGTRLELIADTSNYRGRAKLDRLIFTPTDPSTAMTQVLGGQADFMDAFPIDQVPKLDSSTVARPLVITNFGYAFMALNPYAGKSKTPHPIFGDVRVRRALSMGVDRMAMLHNVYGNVGKISHGPFPMSVPYADSTIKLPPFDTTAARAMLDTAGWRVGADGIRVRNGKPLRFSLATPTSSLFRRRYAVLLQEQLRKLGAQVDVDEMDNKTLINKEQTYDFDAVLASFSYDPSPGGVKQNWSTSGIGAAGQNWLRYSNVKVDALLDSATTAFDAGKSRSYSTRAFQQIADDVPAIWLYDVVLVDAVNRRVTTQQLRPDGWWVTLPDWSIPADKRIDRDRIGLTSSKR